MQTHGDTEVDNFELVEYIMEEAKKCHVDNIISPLDVCFSLLLFG